MTNQTSEYSEMALAAEREGRLKGALADEYANGWPYYDAPTRTRMGEDQARLNFDVVLRALRRARLKLTEASDV